MDLNVQELMNVVSMKQRIENELENKIERNEINRL